MKLSPSPTGRQLLDGSMRIVLAEALFPVTGLLIVAFLTRRLGPEGYGLLTLAATLVAWVEGSIDSLLSRATIKFIGEARDWKPLGLTVVRSYACAGAFTALLVWLLASPIAGILEEPMLATYLSLFALNIPLHSLAQAHRNILVGIGAFRQTAFTSACRWIVRLLFIVILVESGLSIPGAILGIVGASVVELMLYRFHVRPALFRGPTVAARQLLGDAIPLFLFALSLTLCLRLDVVMLKALGGTAAEAGIYGAAQNLVLAPAFVALSFSPLLLSTLSRLLSNGKLDQALETGENAMRAVVGFFPFAAMTAGAAPEIVNFVFGARFLAAGPLLSVLILGTVFQVLISVAAAILIAVRRPGLTLALLGPLLPLVITGHLFLIPRLGPLGASLVTTLFTLIGAAVMHIAVYRLCGILPPSGTLARSILIAMFTYTVASFWPTEGLLLLVKLPLIGLFVITAFRLLGEFSASEIELARSIVGGRTTIAQRRPV